MKKTLTAVALATTIIPINDANAENNTPEIMDVNEENTLKNIEDNTTIKLTKASLSATVFKESADLFDEEGNRIATLKKGDKLQILKKIKNYPFTKVNHNGKAVFIANESISDTEIRSYSGTNLKFESFARVINLGLNETLNVRNTDSAEGDILFTLNPNAGVDVLELTNNGWYKIEFYGNHGYVDSKYIELLEDPINGTEYTGYAKVLSESYSKELPSDKSKNAFKLPLNAGVNTIEKIDSDWIKIKYYDNIGYLKQSNIEMLSTDNDSTNTENITPISMVGEVFGVKDNDTLNVRANSNADSNIIATLNNGDKVNITGKTDNGWYRISLDGTVGFVNSKYIKEHIPSTTKYKVVNEHINLRTAPNWSAEKVKMVRIGETLEVIEVGKDWSKVYFEGQTLYAPTQNLEKLSSEPVAPPKPEKPSTTQYKVINEHINLRTAPNWSAEKVKVVRIGETVEVIELGNEWSKVYFEGQTLYAPTQNLEKLSSEPVAPPKPEKPSTTQYKVINESINLRTGPSWSAEKVKVVKVGETVEVIELGNEWSKVYFEGQTLYAPTQNLATLNGDPVITPKPEKPSTTQHKVIKSDIHLRKSPEWSAEKHRLAKVDEILEVVSIDNGWAKVDDKGIIVYAPSDYVEQVSGDINPNPPTEPNPTPPVEPTPPIEPAPPVEEKPSFTVTDMKMTGEVYNIKDNDVLNIRREPNADAELVTSVKNGTIIEVTGKTDNGWYRVSINGNVGYANSRYIQEYKPSTTTYTVIESDIYLRTAPEWSADKYKLVKKGDSLEVIEINGDWASVYIDGKIMYAPTNNISNGNISTTPGENSVSYTKYPYTLREYIKVQADKSSSYDEDYFEKYINPKYSNKFEFLRLDQFREIDVNKLNQMLSDKNAGVLKGQGEAIVRTAKKYNIDPIYFISQSIHETGYGKSTLASGVTITQIADEDHPIKDSKGNITGYKMIDLPEPVTVYNLYGIGAKDNTSSMPNRALVLGTTYAYNKGWTSVEKAIDGAGEFVSNGYINSSKYKQNTLYKMKYNPNPDYIWHQYATTPWYSRDIAKFIEDFQYMYVNPNFTFDKPLFEGMSEYSLSETSYQEDNSYLTRTKKDITLE